jgi:exonuclease III
MSSNKNRKNKKEGVGWEGGEEEMKRQMTRWIAWNVNGWKTKPGKIRNEICESDVVILTETHLNDTKDEKAEFERRMGKEYDYWHTTDGKNKDARNGVTIMIKTKVSNNRR